MMISTATALHTTSATATATLRSTTTNTATGATTTATTATTSAPHNHQPKQLRTIELSRLKHLLEIEKNYTQIIAHGVQRALNIKGDPLHDK
jgi:hypothetical protein